MYSMAMYSMRTMNRAAARKIVLLRHILFLSKLISLSKLFPSNSHLCIMYSPLSISATPALNQLLSPLFTLPRCNAKVWGTWRHGRHRLWNSRSRAKPGQGAARRSKKVANTL